MGASITFGGGGVPLVAAPLGASLRERKITQSQIYPNRESNPGLFSFLRVVALTTALCRRGVSFFICRRDLAAAVLSFVQLVQLIATLAGPLGTCAAAVLSSPPPPPCYPPANNLSIDCHAGGSPRDLLRHGRLSPGMGLRGRFSPSLALTSRRRHCPL